ncbi:DUF1540 domain-containing protein [Saccharopolyspora phatthalungensis]|uniref:DUF1540 domain-containing protein n=1 Tax=Saccharopolyspora phatthalungensis TaxID=664693 RepID=A0A840QDF2_9PSEU|nr:DUF1540 domain-containing protein [Saccharopolyspora phatthalungensis]MBB5158436.1 hypothetical protein [Saccharopolyspora phatthalungensis]
MEMPLVNRCTAENCAFNREMTCHALAITIGDPEHAQCDTFCSAPVAGGDPAAVGHVGACKMVDCRYNLHLECQAPGISVGYGPDIVDCLTYQPA